MKSKTKSREKPMSQQSQREVVSQPGRRRSIQPEQLLSPDEMDDETQMYLMDYLLENNVASCYITERFLGTEI